MVTEADECGVSIIMNTTNYIFIDREKVISILNNAYIITLYGKNFMLKY